MATRPRRPVASWALAASAAVVAVSLTASCGSDASPSDRTDTTVTTDTPRAEKTGTGERRTDLDPLTKRFAALGTPTSATWCSGTLGDDDVPGPSSYWIDAVVTLDPDTIGSLISTHAAAPTDTRPDIVPELGDDLPAGELLRSPQLDSAFSTSFSTQAWISRESAQVVLTAKGQ